MSTLRHVSFALTSPLSSLIKEVLQKILLNIKEIELPKVKNPGLPPPREPADVTSTAIVQSWIWKRLGQFTRPGDILVAESGTAQFGLPDAVFAPNVNYVTQVYYGSIGYSVGSCLGAAIAQKEIQEQSGSQAGRQILVVGDGSLQLTVQEIGTMIKLGLNPIMQVYFQARCNKATLTSGHRIVINNNGYTIKRAIHGPQESYNDIAT